MHDLNLKILVEAMVMIYLSECSMVALKSNVYSAATCRVFSAYQLDASG